MWVLLNILFVLTSEGPRPDEHQGFLDQHPILAAFLAAEAFLILMRRSDIIKLIKSKSKKTEAEKVQINQGPLRSGLLDGLIFVPISVVLFLLTFFRLIEDRLLRVHNDPLMWHAVAGIAAFGFPFEAIKQFIIEVAKRTIREFGGILNKTTAQRDLDQEKKGSDDGSQE